MTRATWSGTVSGYVAYGFDSNFRLDSLSVNGQSSITYTYDRDGRVTQAGDLELNLGACCGLVLGTSLGAVETTNSYNAFGERAGTTATFGLAGLYAEDQTRDLAGRIATRTETIFGKTSTYIYTYDADSRLVEVRIDGQLSTSYAYDSNGNRLSRTDALSTESGIYDVQDRLLSYGDETYTYTPNGELESRGNARRPDHPLRL